MFTVTFEEKTEEPSIVLIVALMILGFIVSFFFIPNNNIREPNSKIFDVSEQEQNRFYKSLQFQYNAGRWDEIKPLIDQFTIPKGDLINEVVLLPDTPIYYAIKNSEKIQKIEPKVITKQPLADSIYSYKVEYNLPDNKTDGLYRLGVTTKFQSPMSSIKNSEKYLNANINKINIQINDTEKIQEDAIIFDDKRSNSEYLLTLALPANTKSIIVEFNSESSEYYRTKPEISVISTPGIKDIDGEKSFILDETLNSEEKRNLYVINSTLQAGVCVNTTLQANKNIIVKNRLGQNFSFDDYGNNAEKHNSDQNMFSEIFNLKFDVAGGHDYSTGMMGSPCSSYASLLDF